VRRDAIASRRTTTRVVQTRTGFHSRIKGRSKAL